MKYWVYLSGEVPGCFLPDELAATPGFGATTLVCPAEGEILEKNWRRAGEFEDLNAALAARAAKTAEPPPASALGTPPVPGDVDALLDQTGARLFSHVAGLMKELEARREERALAASLQRQLAALKEDVAALRERNAAAESRLPRIGELEENLGRVQAEAAALKEAVAQREASNEENRHAAEKARFELEAARRKLNETANDLAIRNRLVDKLSKDLSEKEVSLTKALALIRRLEQDFHRLDGTRPETPAVEAPRTPAPRAAASAVPELPVLPPAPEPPPPVVPVDAAPAPVAPLTFTHDEPPVAPAYIEPPPPEPSGAQQALSKLLRKVFPGAQH